MNGAGGMDGGTGGDSSSAAWNCCRHANVSNDGHGGFTPMASGLKRRAAATAWDSVMHATAIFRREFLPSLAAACACLLAAADAAPALEWEKSETALALRDGERVVWRFSAGPEAGKPYFHPVSLPDGTVATDHRPDDHKWHLGVWFIFNKLNGVNFWGEDEKGDIWGPGQVKVEEAVFEPRADFSAAISLALAYYAGEERFMAERGTYEVAAPGERANRITSHHQFTAATDVVIDRYDYGGSVFRPARDLMRWRWETAPAFEGQRPFDFAGRFPEQYGKIKNLVRPPAKWMAIVEKPEGPTRGVAILDHPKNPRYPACWGGLAFNANLWLADEMRLARGEKLELRYRMLFFQNETLAAFAEEQHAVFAGETK